jgi:iron complex outermembrane receptor protein
MNGSWNSHYDKSAITPSASLIFKPIPSLSTYFTYMEGLEQGGVAPETYYGHHVTNAGEVFAPMVDKQYEFGAKQTVGKLLITGALFYIDKADQYVDPNTYTYGQDGREVHKGFEFTMTGKVTDNLTLLGGFTIMKCTATKTQTPDTQNDRPVDTADEMAKFYVEYALPQVPGLTLDGGVYYTGSFDNFANTVEYPGVVTFDLGARYKMKLRNTTVTYRLNVQNLTDKNYWMSSDYVGPPRTICGSASLSF